MEKTELDRGFEQALANLYQCREVLLAAIKRDPEGFEEYEANDYCDWLAECM
jgi:hypothetical protein